MKHMRLPSHHKQQNMRITGWEDAILMPRNMNTPQSNTPQTNTFTHINRKQFIQRRRNKEKANGIQNYESVHQVNPEFKFKEILAKKYSTINHHNLSSIGQLKKHMQNIEKIKDRWQQIGVVSQKGERSKKTGKISQSGFIKSQEDGFDEQGLGFQVTRTFIRQVSSCRQNRRRPVSSFRADEKHSITLSDKNNERSKTIHSRGSNRLLSCKNRNLKLKARSNRLNITINQIQSKKMQSILNILLNHS